MPLIAVGGTELFYEMAGPEGAPVVVFSNSIGTTLEMWDGQVGLLSGHRRVLRYDARGHGRSPVVEGAATIETLAGDLAGLLDGLGIETADVVGLSLGGMTAQCFAARWPGRVRSLVLMATSSWMPEGWAARAQTVLSGGMGAIAEGVMGRWFTPAFHGTAGAARQLERFLAIDPRGYAVCCGVIGAMDLRESNGAIRARTLIIAGASDPATPPAMSVGIQERILAGGGDAELVVLPRAAHILNIERADLVNRYLAGFLGVPLGGVSFEAGLANRKAVLGAVHVERSLAGAGRFGRDWQDFITRVAWGEIWGDATIPWKTRSMVTLALMVALGREEEFKLHVRPALQNGVGLAELGALLKQCAVYAGVPAGNGAFRWVREVLGDEVEL